MELLRFMLAELKKSDRTLEQLLVAEAVREAAEKLHYATVAEVRNRLAGVPAPVLDRTLLDLEREGVLQLAPSYNGNVLTDAERASGIRDGRRGNLVYAVTPEESAPAPRKVKRTRVR